MMKKIVLAVGVLLGMFITLVSFSPGQLSQFNTSEGITSKNAANFWVAWTENTFRSKLIWNHVTKLDLLVVAILRKWVNMSNDQFKSYLQSLSGGMTALAKKPHYVNDWEIQNIIGYLVYEINSTVTALDRVPVTSSAMSEIAQLISMEPTDVAGDVKNIEHETLNVSPTTSSIQQNQNLHDTSVKYTTALGGSIQADWQPVIAVQPTEVPQIVNTNSRNKTTFGIFYSAWHCPIVKHPALPILYTSDLTTQFQNQFHFWWKPKLGHYCLTDREDVLKQHAIWLRDAGIEYIVFDSTNHAYLDSRSDRTREMVIEPFVKLLEVWSTIPGAPKVVPWVPVIQGGDVYWEMKNILDTYPSMKFYLKEKPLFLVTGDSERFVADTVAIASLEQTYTVRTMWWLQNGGNLHKWSFLEQNGLNGVRNGEQITVSAAYQQTHITESTGVGKKNGETFKTQFSTVFANPGVDTVLISSWNEWMGQKFVIDGRITYTDSFDEDKNRDIEPQEWWKGSFYYDLMSRCISAYKSGWNSCE
jgi:hypothetical protein